MVKGSFVGIQGSSRNDLPSLMALDALYDLQALLHLVPTNPSTSASDKTRISQALNALSVAAHHYGKRTSTSREGGEANRRGDWLDAEGRLTALAPRSLMPQVSTSTTLLETP